MGQFRSRSRLEHNRLAIIHAKFTVGKRRESKNTIKLTLFNPHAGSPLQPLAHLSSSPHGAGKETSGHLRNRSHNEAVARFQQACSEFRRLPEPPRGGRTPPRGMFTDKAATGGLKRARPPGNGRPGIAGSPPVPQARWPRS